MGLHRPTPSGLQHGLSGCTVNWWACLLYTFGLGPLFGTKWRHVAIATFFECQLSCLTLIWYLKMWSFLWEKKKKKSVVSVQKKKNLETCKVYIYWCQNLKFLRIHYCRLLASFGRNIKCQFLQVLTQPIFLKVLLMLKDQGYSADLTFKQSD